ncbi:hydantoinase/carbamoylase family amidase [Paralcaligenes ureilyticus]|uniref:Allantoate deiminase n=1 Tax=Paralcaligenes ureilyticus TaxID=627131 RepID=A0A4R3MC06_9BURK|nr:hydantoinase/carbamoylase family amidase [Paralcaligenes ureilyticus]TCT09497.1 allantoate deiminase [Paralcaligenes ureilyticus]
MTPKIAVDPVLVERYIMELARFGAVGESGVKRTVYSPEWVAATDQYARWCDEGGLQVRRDAVGNVWGRLDGSAPGGSIASGSHIDTQLPGGRYDGALGALAALIAIRTLKAQFGTPKRSLEAVAFCEEEGSRFPAANYWGSRAVTGRIAADEASTLRDYDGQSMEAVMRVVGLDPACIAQAVRHDIDTFVELHVEQGPVLEHAGLPVGIVTGITGLRHYLVEVTGEANHAGACPMDLRHDPMAGAAEMISGLLSTAENMGRPAVTTIGRMQVEPNYSAIIPHKVSFTIDARHPDPECLAELYSRHEQWLRVVADRRSLQLRWTVLAEHATCACDMDTVHLLEAVAREQGTACMLMHSGAGHDSQVMAHIAKMAMIFVQSRAGRSHTPEEFTSIEHAVMGINVLAAGMYRMAYL